MRTTSIRHQSALAFCGLFLTVLCLNQTVGQQAPPIERPQIDIPKQDDQLPSSVVEKLEQLEEADEYELMKMFVDALDEVQRNYVQPISRRELMEAAIQGVLAKLDVYSNYISPNEIDDFRRDVESEFGGIGIQVELRNRNITVVFPLPGSPGKKAGLRPGDRILEINRKLTNGLNLDQAIRLMKGPIGTNVDVKVRHQDGAEETITVRRDNIVLETVMSHSRSSDGTWNFMLDDASKIGYVRISSFSNRTAEELKAALTQLTKNGMRGLVLDLRFNPGGLLNAAIEVGDMLLPAGRIVSTEGRNVAARSWDAQSEGTFQGFPMAVLVNRYSASASEIVAACLQDNGRAVVIGQRTWGKGSVQKVIELEEGRSALKLTTSSYLRPNGKNIHRSEAATEDDEWGVQPNEGMSLELSDDQIGRIMKAQRDSFSEPTDGRPRLPFYIDPQMERAINYLNSQAR